MPPKKLFYAEATEGYVVKILIDTLSTAMQRTCFRVNKKGFYNRDHDDKTQILFNVRFLRKDFRKFVCHRRMDFSINLKHAQKMIRNVKKKDAVVLYINETSSGEPGNKLWVKIRPSAGTNQRSETVTITITHNPLTVRPLALPEICSSEDGKEKKVYDYPMIVAAQDFQKFKKMTNVGKEAEVEMQKNNYISFYSDCGELYSSKLEFGEIVEEPESSEQEEYSELSESDSFSEEEDSSQESSEEIEEAEVKEWYQEKFNMKLFSTLLKLLGLCAQMEFYAPRIERFPLKIGVKAGSLGKITVYIKDIKQIAYEEAMASEKKKEGV